MKLTRFKVEHFKSIDESEWIDVEQVTTLIGINESGKTNILHALWKLNPASSDGAINLVSDAPRKLFNQLRAQKEVDELNTVFIEAEFLLDDEECLHISKKRQQDPLNVKKVLVSRLYNGMYRIHFPDERKKPINSEELLNFINTKSNEIETTQLLKSENEEKRDKFIQTFNEINTQLSLQIEESSITNIISKLEELVEEKSPKTSKLTVTLDESLAFCNNFLLKIKEPTEENLTSSRQDILSFLPKFVYYSNYGNLDSEIYLPHVIENLTRDSLGSKEAAKVKTLKVLFEFVNLKPQEILDLGRTNSKTQLTEAEITAKANEKKERSILLQSASTDLTTKFRNWWKQGEYRFRFEADGDHFRIWVSDEKRPEEVELEGRSTGLQWFLSFYLTFLVESKDAHRDSILLLDEPGLSLHPLAQKDLSLFFGNLSKTNQIIYTTHSPFLVDSNHLDQVKAVFIQDDGTTNVSSNLRIGESNSDQTKSIYPVHAALGLSVSEMLFNNCEPILVEGSSDQIYLSAIKILLIGLGKITPKKEIIFIPTGGVKGVKPIVSLLTGKNNILPIVLLDSDCSGENMAQSLKKDLYKDCHDSILLLSNFLPFPKAEVEDLIPAKIMIRSARRLLRQDDPDIDFEDEYQEDQPIVNQLEKFAKNNNIVLDKGWKVDLARKVKITLSKVKQEDITEDYISIWQELFNKFISESK